MFNNQMLSLSVCYKPQHLCCSC